MEEVKGLQQCSLVLNLAKPLDKSLAKHMGKNLARRMEWNLAKLLGRKLAINWVNLYGLQS
jgi:hypothetical protein